MTYLSACLCALILAAPLSIRANDICRQAVLGANSEQYSDPRPSQSVIFEQLRSIHARLMGALKKVERPNVLTDLSERQKKDFDQIVKTVMSMMPSNPYAPEVIGKWDEYRVDQPQKPIGVSYGVVHLGYSNLYTNLPHPTIIAHEIAHIFVLAELQRRFETSVELPEGFAQLTYQVEALNERLSLAEINSDNHSGLDDEVEDLLRAAAQIGIKLSISRFGFDVFSAITMPFEYNRTSKLHELLADTVAISTQDALSEISNLTRSSFRDFDPGNLEQPSEDRLPYHDYYYLVRRFIGRLLIGDQANSSDSFDEPTIQSTENVKDVIRLALDSGFTELLFILSDPNQISSSEFEWAGYGRPVAEPDVSASNDRFISELRKGANRLGLTLNEVRR